jgi:hypothetical protein
MEPGVRSILQQHREFDFLSIDLFGCGVTLGHLFHYVQDVNSHKRFCFRADVIGETVFFTRKDHLSEDMARAAKSYGRSFTEAYTTSNDVSLETHHRIINYRLGGLNLLLQFEADAFLGDKLPTQPRPVPQNRTSTLNIIHSQRPIPQGAVLDIETRNHQDSDPRRTIRKQLPRLWLRQVPSFCLAYHNDGLFMPGDVTVINVKEYFQQFEQKPYIQPNIRKLIWLVREIIQVAKSTPSKILEVSYSASGRLKLIEEASSSAAILPDELRKLWNANRTDTAIPPNENRPAVHSRAPTPRTSAPMHATTAPVLLTNVQHWKSPPRQQSGPLIPNTTPPTIAITTNAKPITTNPAGPSPIVAIPAAENPAVTTPSSAVLPHPKPIFIRYFKNKARVGEI